MISYASALQAIRDVMMSRKLGTETVPLVEAVGRICAADLTANIDVQPFDNAAMDGFAVCCAGLGDAGGFPVRVPVSGTICAGEELAGRSVTAGHCWRIMTGAMTPQGCDAVVPVEDALLETAADGGMVAVIARAPAAGQHIRRAGEDFRKGDMLLSRGDKVTAAHILPLATQGIANVTVFKKPRILFVPTGLELVDALGAPLGPGQIYNANRFYAEVFLRALGADVVVHEVVRDDPAQFAGMLAMAGSARYDMIVSSGAVSAGTTDFVSAGLQAAGARILYHKIAMKPGKPNLLAVLPSETLYFGLPGNPVATAVGLRFFVAEALRILRMQKSESPVRARVASAVKLKAGLHLVLKGRLSYGEDGALCVQVLDGQESFKVAPFLHMNGWVQVPPDCDGLVAGDMVDVYALQP